MIALRPFVPAKDFATSRSFYEAFGFGSRQLGGQLCEMRLGAFTFLLQDFYVREWADTFVMHLLVDDLPDW